MRDPWDVRTWTDAELHEMVGRLYTSDMERSMIQAAREELARRTMDGRGPA